MASTLPGHRGHLGVGWVPGCLGTIPWRQGRLEAILCVSGPAGTELTLLTGVTLSHSLSSC